MTSMRFWPGAALAAVFAAGIVAPASAQEFTLRIAHHYPPVQLQAKGYASFAAQVEKNSGGRIKVRIYPSNTLITGEESIDAVKAGVVEASAMVASYHVGKLPDLDAMQLPYLFENAQHFRRALDAGVRAHIAALYDQNGIRLLNYFHKGAIHVFHASAFLLTPVDYKGQDIRGLGGSMTAMLKALGANSVTLPVGEVSAALERKVIKAVATNCTAHISRGWVEHLKYVTFTDMAQSGEGLGINKAFFDKLPPDLQKVVLDAAAVMNEEEWSTVIDYDEKNCFDLWTEKKAQVKKLTPEQRAAMRQAMMSVYDSVTARLPFAKTVTDIAAKTR